MFHMVNPGIILPTTDGRSPWNYASGPYGSAQVTYRVACSPPGQSTVSTIQGEVGWSCPDGCHTLGTQSQGDPPDAWLGYSPPTRLLVSLCAHFCSFVLPPVPLAAVILCILERQR